MRRHHHFAALVALAFVLGLEPSFAYAQGVESAAGDFGRVFLTSIAMILAVTAGGLAMASGFGRIPTSVAAPFVLATVLVFCLWLIYWRTFVLWSTWLGAALTVGAALLGLIVRKRRMHG